MTSFKGSFICLLKPDDTFEAAAVQLLSSTTLAAQQTHDVSLGPTEAPAFTVRRSDLSDASFNTPYNDALLSQRKWPRRGFRACDFQIQNFEGLFFPVSCTPLLEL